MSLHFILSLEKKKKTPLKQTIQPHHTLLCSGGSLRSLQRETEGRRFLLQFLMGETAFSKEASSLFGERRLRDGVRLRGPQEGSGSGLAVPGRRQTPEHGTCLEASFAPL